MRSSKSREYRMRKRAEDVDRTRQTIVEAAVEAHRTLGLGASMSQIAEMAGVTRATLYRHFPTLPHLQNACSAHWRSAQDFPDPARWTGGNEGQKVRSALSDVYRHYAEAQSMKANLRRDWDLLPAPLQDGIREQERQLLAAFLGLLDPEHGRRAVVRKVAAHVLDFGTWQSLVASQRVKPATAVELLAGLMEAAERS